jgi:flagellar motor protein MotB
MRLRAGLVVALPLALACGSPAPSPLFYDLGRAREGAAAREAQRLAPQAFGEAEAIRAEADRAWQSGDPVLGALLAEQALAAYERAFVLARLARATEEAATAEADLANRRSELAALAAQREQAEREAAELEKKVVLARERLAPLPAGPADATREAARLVAARSLAMQARLLCSAAELVFPAAAGLEAQKKALAELDRQLAGRPRPAPIDAAGRARGGCLEVLTLARRSADRAQTTEPDALLAELSASGDLSPSRDERGVVVTLRDAFRGTKLAPGVEAKVEALGRVAAAHPGLGVQVVLHDAAEPTSTRDRVAPIVKHLVAGGALEAKIRVELAGTALPLVDPADAKNRGRNARVEIVFVGR